MKKSTFTIALSTALACAVLQSRPAAAQLKTQTVDYKLADTALEGYLAYDGNVTGKRPGILLVHRRDGMSDFTRKHADMIAKLGYVVFAADIFGKDVRPKDIPEAQVQSTKYNKDRPLMRARAQAGLDTLRQNSMVDPSRIAVIGYCFGGTVALELSHTGAPVVGTVSVHGSYRDFTPGAAKNIKGRVLILHGAEDPTAPLSEVDLVIKELRQTQVDWQLELYSGADHTFTTPDTPANDRANVRAWGATQKFFSEVFKN
jgi:dienelactone hydrolase